MLLAAYVRDLRNRRLPAQWGDRLLGGACFATAATDDCAPPLLPVAAPPLGGTGAVAEIWGSDATCHVGEDGGIAYRCDGQILFGACSLAEESFAASDAASGLQQASERAYRDVIAAIDRLGFPHLLRVWNYIPQINRETGGVERYRQFNVGRHAGLAATARATRGDVPAACALGVDGGPLTVYFLAGREAPLAIENPRQVSAYDYPPQYGRRSPTFARASLAQLGAQRLLFISGTASIVGHRSVHIDDVAAQTLESLRNVAAVVDEANRRVGSECFSAADLAYKAYVRHAGDFAVVRREIEAALGDAPVLYLRADICRSDLLVEIEASGGHALEML